MKRQGRVDVLCFVDMLWDREWEGVRLMTDPVLSTLLYPPFLFFFLVGNKRT